MKDVNVYLYKMIIWVGLLIPNRKVIKFISAEEIDIVRDWVAEMLNGNALCIVDYKEKIRCVDRTNIRDITVKQIKKL